MRARTKIRGSERFGVRHQDARTLKLNLLTEWEEDEDEARKRHAKCRAEKRPCKFVRGTSVRLAPLVELPAWEQDTPTFWAVSSNGHHIGVTIEADPSDVGNLDSFEVEVHDEDGSRLESILLLRSTLVAAKAWAEEQLLARGFKVAKAVP